MRATGSLVCHDTAPINLRSQTTPVGQHVADQHAALGSIGAIPFLRLWGVLGPRNMLCIVPTRIRQSPSTSTTCSPGSTSSMRRSRCVSCWCGKRSSISASAGRAAPRPRAPRTSPRRTPGRATCSAASRRAGQANGRVSFAPRRAGAGRAPTGRARRRPEPR